MLRLLRRYRVTRVLIGNFDRDFCKLANITPSPLVPSFTEY